MPCIIICYCNALVLILTHDYIVLIPLYHNAIKPREIVYFIRYKTICYIVVLFFCCVASCCCVVVILFIVLLCVVLVHVRTQQYNNKATCLDRCVVRYISTQQYSYILVCFVVDNLLWITFKVVGWWGKQETLRALYPNKCLRKQNFHFLPFLPNFTISVNFQILPFLGIYGRGGGIIYIMIDFYTFCRGWFLEFFSIFGKIFWVAIHNPIIISFTLHNTPTITISTINKRTTNHKPVHSSVTKTNIKNINSGEITTAVNLN